MATDPVSKIFVTLEKQCQLCEHVNEAPVKLCAKCGANAAGRAFGAIVRGMLRQFDPKQASAPLVSMGLRLARNETTLLEAFGKCLPPPTSTFHELSNPATLQRVVELHGIDEQSIDLLYSPPWLCEFLTDVDQVIASAGRVLRSRGVAMLAYSNGRKPIEGDAAPTRTRKLDPVEYKLPAGIEIWSVQVGREWIFSSIRKAGLTPFWVEVIDSADSTKFEYFLGQKP